MDPMKNVEIDEAKVMDKFGVGPDKITDVQALIGDSVDNIPRRSWYWSQNSCKIN